MNNENKLIAIVITIIIVVVISIATIQIIKDKEVAKHLKEKETGLVCYTSYESPKKDEEDLWFTHQCSKEELIKIFHENLTTNL